MNVQTEIGIAQTDRRALPGQIVLVLQDGGALGAYQARVYQALHEAGVEPNWVIGTSIGAINASLIAGNPFEARIDCIDEFWRRVAHSGWRDSLAASPFTAMANWMTLMQGVGSFFLPNPAAFFSVHAPLGAERAGCYSTAPLRRTLEALVDFERIKNGPMRLTVGAASDRTGEMRYFDSRDSRLDVRHVMATGALPPALPAIRIDGDLWWDGGILSNTPVEAMFDDNPRRDSVVFAVHLWYPKGREPESIWQVMNRQKDIQ